VVVVDGGLSLQPKRPMRDAAEEKQRRDKAGLLLDSLAEADAVAFGADDWALGTTWLRDAVTARDVPLVAANLTCDGEAPFPATKVVEAGGRRIGIAGVTVGPVEGCEVGPLQPALAEAVASLSAVDAVVALVPVARDRELAAALEGTDEVAAVIDATGRYAAHGPEEHAGTWAFGSGTRGKYLGVLELVFVPGGDSWAPVGVVERLEGRLEKLQSRLASLRQRIEREEDPKRKAAFERQLPRLEDDVAAVEGELSSARGAEGTNQLRPDARALDRAIDDHAGWLARVEALNAEFTAEAGGGPPVARRKAPEGSPFVGAEVCSACHPEQSVQWSTTPHAKALSTLAATNHAADEGCVRCHATGYGMEGGPSSPVDVGGFRDVQCEACHGPGRAHVSAPYEVDLVVDPPESLCKTCHNEEQDNGDFDYATYRPKVDHGVEPPPAPGGAPAPEPPTRE